MPATDSVTTWLGQLHCGQEDALTKLHGRYWPWLVRLARKKLHGIRLHEADEEDVAQQAFLSFYRRFKAGGVPQLTNRHDFLALLSTIVACKAINQVQRELGVKKRGGGILQGESAITPNADGAACGASIEQLADSVQSPFEIIVLQENYECFVEKLPDNLREFGVLYLAGCTQKEIAEQLKCGLRTVERKLALLFVRWQEMAQRVADESP